MGERQKEPRPRLRFWFVSPSSKKNHGLSSIHSAFDYEFPIPSLLAMPLSPSSSSTPSLPSTDEVKTEVVAATKSTLAGLRSLVAGGVGGVCAVVVGHPFDLVKVRLQTAEKGVYTGAIDVVRRTIAREGLARVVLESRGNS